MPIQNENTVRERTRREAIDEMLVKAANLARENDQAVLRLRASLVGAPPEEQRPEESTVGGVTMSTTPQEGWGVVTGKKAHYYRDTISLCRKRGFYRGPLEADDKPTPDDCAQCRRKLDAEQREGKAT